MTGFVFQSHEMSNAMEIMAMLWQLKENGLKLLFDEKLIRNEVIFWVIYDFEFSYQNYNQPRIRIKIIHKIVTFNLVT